MYVYIESENFVDDDGERKHVFTVGFYKPDGKFEGDSDHSYRENAAARVNYLNGALAGDVADSIKRVMDVIYEHGLSVQNNY